MNKNVLFIFPEKMASSGGLKKAIVNNNSDNIIFTYKYSKLDFIKYLIFRNSRFISSGSENQFNKFIEKELNIVIKEKQIDLLFIIVGAKLSEKSHKIIKNLSVPIAFWCIDSMNRHPSRYHAVPYSKLVLYHDGLDFENSNHPGKIWQPFGFNDEFYRPQNKIYDIAFIGNIKTGVYDKRFNFLKQLVESNLKDKYTVVLAVSDPDHRLDTLEYEEKNITVKLSLNEQNYAQTIASARLTVNILQDDGGKPINPPFFGISFANSIQIIDERNYFSTFGIIDDTYFPVTESNFLERIEKLLTQNPVVSNRNIIYSFSSIINSTIKKVFELDVKSDEKMKTLCS